MLGDAAVQTFLQAPAPRCSSCLGGGTLVDCFWGTKCLCEHCELMIARPFYALPRKKDGYTWADAPPLPIAEVLGELFNINHAKARHHVNLVESEFETIYNAKCEIAHPPESDVEESDDEPLSGGGVGDFVAQVQVAQENTLDDLMQRVTGVVQPLKEANMICSSPAQYTDKIRSMLKHAVESRSRANAQHDALILALVDSLPLHADA